MVVTEDGSWTLAHPEHGETCHSRSGAWLEARERYAVPCELAARACGRAELRLLDVGTGLGWNIAAALAALGETEVALRVDTLERDQSVLLRTVELARRPLPKLSRGGPERPGVRWHSAAIDAIEGALADPGGHAVLGERGTLRLFLGDARETLATLPLASYDAVFLDPFSPRVEPESWEPAFLAALARSMASGGRLSTYSAATRVRAGLAAAGLVVGPGPRVGAKAEGTLASRGGVVPPFTQRVERRIRRAAEDLARRGEGNPRSFA